MKKISALVLILVCATSAPAQKLAVKIIDRQDSDTDYSYVVPAHWFSSSNTDLSCGGSDTNVDCNGSTNTTGTITPAHQVPYHVRGATFTLLLLDGRAAVVNCEANLRSGSRVVREITEVAACRSWKRLTLNFTETMRS